MSPQLRNGSLAAAAAAFFLLPAFGQKTGGTTTTTAPTTTTTAPTTGTVPTRLPTSTTTTNPTTTPNTTTRPPAIILVTGKVVTDDGSVLPSNVIIETLCGGRSHAEGYADAKGNFSIQLGKNSNVVDASEGGGTFNTNTMASGDLGGGMPGFSGFSSPYSNCELRARVAGYRSQSVNLVNRGPMDNPDVGSILVHSLMGTEEGSTVTLTTLKAPKDAKKAYQKGLDFLKKDKNTEAAAQFETAVAQYPEYAIAWCALGRVKVDTGTDTEGAHTAFETAAKLEPRWPDPKMELALMAGRVKNWPELAVRTEEVLRLNSFEYPQAFFFNSVANYNLRHFEIAEKSARSAQKLDTQHQYPQISHVLGAILAARKQYSAAADELRHYLTMSPSAEDAPAARKQLTEMESMLLTSEVRNEK